MTQPVVHKKVLVVMDYLSACGLYRWWLNDVNVRRGALRWQDVTCKNCLRTRRGK